MTAAERRVLDRALKWVRAFERAAAYDGADYIHDLSLGGKADDAEEMLEKAVKALRKERAK